MQIAVSDTEAVVQLPRADASGGSPLVAERLAHATDDLAAAALPVRIFPERHKPYLYELACPAVVTFGADGEVQAGVDPVAKGAAGVH